MGCLLFPFELLVDGIIQGWFYLMEWIIPERYISNTFRLVLKIFVFIFSFLLLFTMMIGVLAMIIGDADVTRIGKCMFFIPFGIGVVQIVLGIIVRVISKKKK